jgi:hypothetical protein
MSQNQILLTITRASPDSCQALVPPVTDQLGSICIFSARSLSSRAIASNGKTSLALLRQTADFAANDLTRISLLILEQMANPGHHSHRQRAPGSDEDATIGGSGLARPKAACSRCRGSQTQQAKPDRQFVKVMHRFEAPLGMNHQI